MAAVFWPSGMSSKRALPTPFVETKDRTTEELNEGFVAKSP